MDEIAKRYRMQTLKTTSPEMFFMPEDGGMRVFRLDRFSRARSNGKCVVYRNKRNDVK